MKRIISTGWIIANIALACVPCAAFAAEVEKKNSPPELLIAAADDDKDAITFCGQASWYGVPFNGRKTASGEIFDMNKLSGAHKTLPMPTKVLVENPRNGRSTVVRINDRGPFVRGRVLDLSREAARRIGTFPGIGYVEATVIGSQDD